MLNHLFLIIGYFGQNITWSVASLMLCQYSEDFGGWGSPTRTAQVAGG